MSGRVVIKKSKQLPNCWIIYDGILVVGHVILDKASVGDRRRILTALVREYAPDMAEAILLGS